MKKYLIAFVLFASCESKQARLHRQIRTLDSVWHVKYVRDSIESREKYVADSLKVLQAYKDSVSKQILPLFLSQSALEQELNSVRFRMMKLLAEGNVEAYNSMVPEENNLVTRKNAIVTVRMALSRTIDSLKILN